MSVTANALVKENYSELRNIFFRHIGVSADDLATRAMEMKQEEGYDPVEEEEKDVERGMTEDGVSDEPAPDLSQADENVIHVDFQRNQEDANEMYFAGENEEQKEPATQQVIDEAFTEKPEPVQEPVHRQETQQRASNPYQFNQQASQQAHQALERARQIQKKKDMEMRAALESNRLLKSQVSEMQETMRRMVAHKQHKQPEKKDTTLYKKDSISFNGKDMNIECMMEKADARAMGFKAPNESSNYRWENFYAYRNGLTEQVLSYIGRSRVSSVYVHDNRLIVNGVNYVPVIEKQWQDTLPLDMVAYLKNGMVAPFFNWGILPKLHALRVLGFDNMEFVLMYPAEDLGIGRRFGVSSFFKKCDSLETLTIGTDTVTREELNTPASAPIKHKMSICKRFTNMTDECNLSLCKGTQGLQNFFVGSLKDYAKNRGDKGFIHYAFGTSLRAVGAVASGGANFVSHALKFVVDAFSTASTPIDESELTGGNVYEEE